MQASTPFIMSWTCFGSFSNPAVSFQGRCRKERRDWGNYRSLGQRIEDRLRSPTYLRAPQTQTPSRALTGRSVRVNGREIETKSVLRMCPLKLLLWCFFCSSRLEVTAVSLFISVWEEHTTTQEAKAGLDRFSAVITAFVSDKKKKVTSGALMTYSSGSADHQQMAADYTSKLKWDLFFQHVSSNLLMQLALDVLGMAFDRITLKQRHFDYMFMLIAQRQEKSIPSLTCVKRLVKLNATGQTRSWYHAACNQSVSFDMLAYKHWAEPLHRQLDRERLRRTTKLWC